MIVLKFGGTSVGTPERIKQIKAILQTYQTNIAVVVSAFGGTTDQLLEAAHLAKEGNDQYKNILQQINDRHNQAVQELLGKNKLPYIQNAFLELKDILHGVSLLKELSKASLDLIASFGERLSANIISNYLQAEFLDTRTLIKTDSQFQNAKVDFKTTNQNIKQYFKTHKKLQIITGFIASNQDNKTTTLGRGGSDYTASIFGAALNAEEIHIWTDVSGIMSADPRKVSEAFPLEQISFKEAMEMSHFGAKVIYPPTMRPAMKAKVPIRIKNTMEPQHPGSLITTHSDKFGKTIKGISSIDSVALLTLEGSGMQGVPGISQKLFSALAEEEISVILISQASSEHSICFAINPEHTEQAKQAIEKKFAQEIANKEVNPVIIEKDLCILAVVGKNMCALPGTSGKVFSALGRNGINVKAIAQGSSELNISIVIDKVNESKALNVIHDSLFLSDLPTLNLFMVGPGLVGQTLLKQIQEQNRTLTQEQNLKLKLVGLANSKNMLIKEQGIDLQDWQTQLTKAPKADLQKFIEHIKHLNLQNSVFIDCSSSETVAQTYQELLENSISVVTPNKKANSADLLSYLNLTRVASKSGAKFYYETNVGAGLPIIKTLQDLQLSGDKIHHIQAILSGTLSYLFNNYDGQTPFSTLVKQAQEQGYTEPDPRDDLNGLDVARKILILARETNCLLELSDIDVENLVPEDCQQAKSLEEFYQKLQKHDQYFQNLYQQAHQDNKRLRYIASFDGQKAQVKLQAVDKDHPFYNLSGTDNIISIKSHYYNNTPLVVRGPGAGAGVTAAGVLADIIRIANIDNNNQITKFSFLDKLKNNNLKISLIGMSNIGKSHWSKKLKTLGFNHIDCDQLIENKLEPELKERGYRGLADMSKWLGQPTDSQFPENEAKYLNCEKETMREIIEQKAQNNTVIDTTGSIIHTGKEIMSQLKKHSLVIYIKAPDNMKQQMLEKYKSCPKPVVWDNTYDNKKGLEKSYMDLLNKREQLYEQLADIVINAHDTKDINQNQFLKLIQEQL